MQLASASVAGRHLPLMLLGFSAQLSSQPTMTTTTTTTTTTATTTISTLCQETTLDDLQNALSQTHQDVLIKNQALLVSVAESVKEYMSQYDLSHDFHHILRVLTLSRRILDAECSQSENGGIEYDPLVIFLSAYEHAPTPCIYTQSQSY